MTESPPPARRSTDEPQLGRGGDCGQAAVEFALALPVVLVVLLVVAQLGVVVRDEVAVRHAAREGARAAAVSSDPAGAAGRAARRAVSLPVDVSTSVRGDLVVVTVTFVDPTDVPVVGRFLGPVTHVANATMTLEPP